MAVLPHDWPVVAFKVYDLDGNGFIERHELLKLADAIHKFVDLSQQHAPKQGMRAADGSVRGWC